MDELITVESSRIGAVGWKEGLLTVRFKNSSVYIYKGVPEKVYQDLMAAPSKGKFFHENIRNDFPGEKVLGKIVESTTAG